MAYVGGLHSNDIIGNYHKIIFSIRINSELPYYKKYRKQSDCSLKNMFSLRKFYKNKKCEDLYEIKSADEAFTYFITYIKNMFNICCPEKQIQINDKKRHAWISIELKNKITKREELLAKMYKQPTLEYIETYKNYKNKVLSELAKSFFFKLQTGI